jgi:uncharacterized RDD family membrane protein YckC
MTYPEWWQRFLAALIDGVIFVIIVLIVQLIFIPLLGAVAGSLIASILITAIIVAYKVIFEGGPLQATPGKMCFGLKLVNDQSAKVSQQQAFMRTWPWWLNLLTVLSAFSLTLSTILSLLVLIAVIVIFCTFFMDPVGRCIHDQTAQCHIIKAGKGMFA